ncbi:MAG: hypothetical protein M0021_13075 [Clostridia bacterium]|nr:hypothetical protein [Clostridia bacterium]
MEDDILQIINKYYQGEISDQLEEFYETEQHKRLIQQKIDAAINPDIFDEFLQMLAQKMSEYDYRDVTSLGLEGNDVCHTVEILLYKYAKFHENNAEGDFKSINELGGKMTTLTVSISILGPYYCYDIMDLCYDDSDQDFHWKTIFDIPVEHSNLWEEIQKFFQTRNYSLLNKEILSERVPWVYLETVEKGEATVFNCLFSEIRGGFLITK